MIRITFIFLFIINVSFSQAPTIEWERSYGGNQLEIANGICQTPDGGYVFIGSTNSQNGDVVGNPYPFLSFYNRTYWIVKISPTGTIEWQKIYGGYNHDEPTAIKPTTDGGFIVSGYSESSAGDVTNHIGDYDFWILKLNAVGDLQWQKNLGGTSIDKAMDIIQTSDGGYATVGFRRYPSTGGDHSYNEVYVVKLGDSGTTQWSKRFGGSGYDMGYGIVQTTEGGYMIAGRTASIDGDVTNNHGLFDAWIIKVNADGIAEWKKTYGGTADDAAVSIVKADDGNYVVLGETKSNDGDVTLNHGNADLWAFKIDPAGNLIWQNTYGGPNMQTTGIYMVADPDQAQAPGGSISKTSDNGFLICGTTYGDIPGHHGSGNTDGYIARIDNGGAVVWERAFGGGNYDESAQIIQTADNGYIVAAQNSSHINNPGDWSNNHGNYDAWILKFNAPLNVAAFDGKEQIMLFPNPAHTTLFVKTNENERIDKIVITDIAGREVLVKTSNVSEIGVTALPSGVYFIEAVTERKTFKSKFIKV